MAVGGGLRKNKWLTCDLFQKQEHKAGNGFGHVCSFPPFCHHRGPEAGTVYWEPVLPGLCAQMFSWSPYLGLAPRAWQPLKGAALCREQAALLGVGSNGAKWLETEPGLIRLGTRSSSLTRVPHPLLVPGLTPVFSHEFLRSKKRHLCILKSQRPVLNVPTSERKHIAFPIVVQGKRAQLSPVLTAPSRPIGCQVLVWAKLLRTNSRASAAVNFRLLFVYKCF